MAYFEFIGITFVIGLIHLLYRRFIFKFWDEESIIYFFILGIIPGFNILYGVGCLFLLLTDIEDTHKVKGMTDIEREKYHFTHRYS